MLFFNQRLVALPFSTIHYMLSAKRDHHLYEYVIGEAHSEYFVYYCLFINKFRLLS